MRWPGVFRSQVRPGTPCCITWRMRRWKAYISPDVQSRSRRAPTIDQCGPQKHGMVSVTHSTGRSERSSWMAANSGCTSAQSSCSHSLHARRSPGSPGARAGSGCSASHAAGARSAGSSESSSKRIVVPERAGPVTMIGATTCSAAIFGLASHAALSRRRVRSERSSSWRVMSRPTTCSGDASAAVASCSKRACHCGSPRSPRGATPATLLRLRQQVRRIDRHEPARVAADRAGHRVEAPHPVRPSVALGHRLHREHRGSSDPLTVRQSMT